MSASNAQQIAERVRDDLYSRDRAAHLLGIEVAAVGAGSATTTMTVRDDMLNGHGICHGGFVATLADTCFAYACNAYDELTVASGFGVDLMAAGRLGDVLTARGVELSRGGRTGVYDVAVTNQRGEAVAVFRGRSYTIRGKPSIRPAEA